MLLRRFYADVKQHNEIGPIFAAHIDDWPSHMEKIANFWSGLTGGPALYGGGFAGRHMPLMFWKDLSIAMIQQPELSLNSIGVESDSAPKGVR